jgi:hypothetical protein
MAKTKKTPCQSVFSADANPRVIAAQVATTCSSPCCLQPPRACHPPAYLAQDQRGELSRSCISAVAIQDLRNYFLLHNEMKTMLLVSITTNDMIRYVLMYPEVWLLDCTAGEWGYANACSSIWLCTNWLSSFWFYAIWFTFPCITFPQAQIDRKGTFCNGCLFWEWGHSPRKSDYHTICSEVGISCHLPACISTFVFI